MRFNQDATYYAQSIQNGTYTSSQLTQRALANIETLNPQLNAVTAVYADEALQTARRLDQQLATMTEAERKQLPVFYGLPLLLKDIGQFLEGTVTSSGSHLYKSDVATHTDHAIRLAQEAGLVFVGRSNIPELGMKTVSDSGYYGPVCNPVNLDYNPGGSSGGAAAAVKAGMVPLATASDAGGSIRVPASDTGLIGLKPSRGRVAEGPGVYRPVNGLATNLILSRSVRDSFHYLRTVQKEQVTNLYRLPEISEPELKALDRPLKIAYSRQHPRGGALSKDAANALETSLGALRALGHTLEEVTLDVDQEAILHYYYLVMGLESGKLVREAEATGKKVRWGEVDPLVWVAYQLAPHVPATAYSDFNAFQDQLFEYMELLYQDYDIYLTPTVSDVAMKNADLAYPPALLARIQEMGSLHASEVWDVTKATFDHTYLRTSYNQLMNITGQPAISLPLFENADGLPLGTQLAAKRGDEYVLLQLAVQLEAAGYLKAGNVEM